jgi:hypothetical protein
LGNTQQASSNSVVIVDANPAGFWSAYNSTLGGGNVSAISVAEQGGEW